MNMMHGNDWSGQDVGGWWVSEKFDGHRIRWTGSEMLTRGGHKLNAPAWFTNGLPEIELDCELWAGRGNDHNTVRRLVSNEDWPALELIAFDVPGKSAREAVEILSTVRNSAKFQQVKSTEHALQLMREVVECGGEGVMLRRPGSDYQPFRTNDLLKLKP